MRCPNCNSELKRTGGANLEDFVCTNYNYCPESLECKYWINVKVRDNYWFSPSYSIPFKFNNQWYVALGPFYDRYDSDYAITRFQKLSLDGSIYEGYPVSVQQDIYDIPYMALPVNEDFNYQLDILINKLGRYLDKLIALK